MKFSVLMSVYIGSNEAEVRRCLDGVLSSTLVPDQTVVVVDGPIDEGLKAAVDEYENAGKITTVRLEENSGLAVALDEGLKACENELVMRMDTDDIVEPDRFALQVEAFENDPELSACGGHIAEWCDRPDEIISYRKLPLEHDDIVEFMKGRCPFNHMTVAFKKSEVAKAGGYKHLLYVEDYYLWVRMYLAGCKFKNIDKVLVRAHVDRDTFARRGGRKHYDSEKTLLKFMLENGVITRGRYIKSKTVRFIGGVMLPGKLRAWAYKKLLRS